MKENYRNEFLVGIKDYERGTDINGLGGYVIKDPTEAGSDCYTHLEGVTLEKGEDDYKATWWGRGDLLVMTFQSELTAKPFDICIGFHKGQNYMFSREHKNPTVKTLLESSKIEEERKTETVGLDLFEDESNN